MPLMSTVLTTTMYLEGVGGNNSHQVCVGFAKNGQILKTNSKHVKKITHEL